MINSGKWVEDMNKLEYELNQVARKATQKTTEENARKFGIYAKKHGSNKENIIQDATDMFGDVLSLDEIKELVQANY